MSIVAWLVVGLIAGFLASKVVNKSGSGLVFDIVLGRRLISGDPKACAEELDGSEEVIASFVVSGSQASSVFEFPEETLDQITVAIQEAAERKAFTTIALGWDVGEASL